MEITGLDVFEAFAQKHPKSRRSLDTWLSVARTATWNSLEDIRRSYNSVDYIRERGLYCFNIGGNKYRLIAMISIKEGCLNIEHIFTHSEYDKWNASK
jgi:mRNA interferase HigB